jgi:16S rRNA G966 N2-methylase RsmD
MWRHIQSHNHVAMGKRKRHRSPQQQYWIQDCPNLVPLPLEKEVLADPAVPVPKSSDSEQLLPKPLYHPSVQVVLREKDDSLLLLITEARLQDRHHAMNTDIVSPVEPVSLVTGQYPQHWFGCIRSDAAAVKAKQEDPTPTDTADSPEIYIKRIIFPRSNHPCRSEDKRKKQTFRDLPNGDCGDGVVNPFPTAQVPDKYWAQRKRYFSKFDDGIRLDAEGWFSVTPEVIAHHIARRMIRSSIASTGDKPVVVLDAFVGMGGNSIAFAQYPEVDMVVCVDTDVEKLFMAAKNCAVYDIPKSKLLFLHGNACRVLEYYQNGRLCLNRSFPSNETNSLPEFIMRPEPALDTHIQEKTTDKTCGYKFGTYNALPQQLDVIFLSPPWGGTNYESVGRRHYSLECIQLHPSEPTACLEEVNGEALLGLAVTALPSDQLNIAYFLPRNLNGLMFGLSCHKHIRGCVDLEQNIVNGKLKTITAYIQRRICTAEVSP